QMAVIDITTATVRAYRKLALTVYPNAIAVDEHYVYVPLIDADAFVLLSPTDLSEVRRIFTPGRIDRLEPAGTTVFANCNIRNASQESLVFALPDLQPIDLHLPNPYLA